MAGTSPAMTPAGAIPSSRVPPAAGNDDAVRNDPAVAGEVFAHDIDVIKLSVLDRQYGGISHAAGLEAAEAEPLQRECGVAGRCRNDIGERHSQAQEFRHGGDLVKSRTVDAERMHIR